MENASSVVSTECAHCAAIWPSARARRKIWRHKIALRGNEHIKSKLKKRTLTQEEGKESSDGRAPSNSSWQFALLNSVVVVERDARASRVRA